MSEGQLSVIVPVLNESTGIADFLASIQWLRKRGHEIIVSDGGSCDSTPEIAAPLCDAIVSAPAGRGSQMNRGANNSNGEFLLFLHADTRLPADADRLVRKALGASPWGRFDVRIVGRSAMLPVIARLINLRSRLTGIATGDQAIFVRRSTFDEVGGFAEIPLMEDVELSKRLHKLALPSCLDAVVSTSGRRWDDNGAWRTILLMWRLRLAFWRGADPHALARSYGYAPREG